MKPWNLNFRHLRAFAKTYEMGTLLAASRAVHMSQPAMSQAIARLEDQLDISLFERQVDGMVPTSAGSVFYPRVEAALKLIRSNRITHAQARAFVALAKGGSYTQASKYTGLARASLNRAVKDMEAALGQSYVTRRGRGIDITAEGKRAYRRLRLAQSELQAGIEELLALRGENFGRVSIGAMPLCRARVLPKAIVKFRDDYPACAVDVTEGSYSELVELLRNGELDLLIGALRQSDSTRDVKEEPLFVDWPVIIARSGHPVTSQKTRDIRTLSQYEWCLPKRGVPLRESWQAMFEQAELVAPNINLECSSVMTIRQILMQTDCLTVLSPDQLATELEAGWFQIIGQTSPSMKRTIGMICREDWRPTAHQSAFIETLKVMS